MSAFVYILLCGDGSYYVGSARGETADKRIGSILTGFERLHGPLLELSNRGKRMESKSQVETGSIFRRFAARFQRSALDTLALSEPESLVFRVIEENFRLWLNGWFKSTSEDYRIAFGFYKNERVNARADVIENWGLIGLNTGTVYAIWNLSSSICSGAVWLGVDQDRSEDFAVFHQKFLPEPKGLFESRLAVWLYMTACRWLLLHELAHIRNGHCDLLLEIRGIKEFDEVNMAKLEGVTYLDIQTLEMDAETLICSPLITL